MRVTRITIDADLGLIELRTGPGGDGNYVLLPLEVSEALQRYVTMAGEPCTAEEPTYSGMQESPEEARSGGSIVAPGGWSVPADQAYDYNTTPGLGAYEAAISDPIKVERGGYKYPSGPRVGVEYTRSPELQKEFNKYLAADMLITSEHYGPRAEEVEEEEVTVELTNLNGENIGTMKIPASLAVEGECDGNCGAHPVHPIVESAYAKADAERAEDIARQQADWSGGKKGKADDVWTRAPGEGEPSKERHTGPATITNPIRVFADEHSRGYRLHSPALPGWRADINQYDLYKVPGMIREALVDMGSDHAINYPVTITVMEEEQ